MAATTNDASQTLKLLEERLRRIEYAVNGYNEADQTEPEQQQRSAAARLRTLERTLQTLASKSPATADILRLQKQHPDILQAPAESSARPILAPSSLAALVLAHAPLYHSTAGHLRQLETQHVPDPADAAKLIAMEPRLSKAFAREAELAREVQELRARSAKAVEGWYEGGVLHMGDLWAEWEERLRDSEIVVRRAETRRKREDEGTV